jgi:cyclopropane-fatty-acyl-phospholipid synthase
VSTQADVEVSYDVSNDFFRLWLDRRMNYTCALFDGTDDLDRAQERKLEWHAAAAGITPQSRLLDIGCGWGACLDYMTTEKGVRSATGITLSPSQAAEVRARGLPGVDVRCVSYEDFEPDGRFDAVVCICMMEHICTPGQVRAGEHIARYRDFFGRVWRWTTPGARFGLQTILRDRVPRDRRDLADVAWVTTEIFPGGLSLRMEDVVRAVSPWWEIVTVQTRREDYRRTCEKWRRRLRAAEPVVRERWGDRLFDDYDRYLSTCIRAFERRYQSLAQWALVRVDDAPPPPGGVRP